jgi:N-acetylneuraminate synthase/sialic acid synthase
MSKKLVAACNLPEGHSLTLSDIAIKSPGDGLPPYELDNVVGKKLKTSLLEDEDIHFDNLD